MGQVGIVADWNAHAHPQEEVSIQGQHLVTLRECRLCCMSLYFSREDKYLDFNVKVSGPLCTIVQIVKGQQANCIWLFGNQAKDYSRVKFNPLVGSLQLLVSTVSKFFLREMRSVFR